MPHRINKDEGIPYLNNRKQYTTEEALNIAEKRSKAKAKSRKVKDEQWQEKEDRDLALEEEIAKMTSE